MLARKRATLIRLTTKQATLRLDNGQELTLLRDELEPAVAEGMEFVVTVAPREEADLAQADLSRTLLSQILDHVDPLPQNGA